MTRKSIIGGVVGLLFGVFTVLGVKGYYRDQVQEDYKVVPVEFANDRYRIEFKTSSFEVDNILLPFVEEFVTEAIKHDINMDSLSRTYMGIYYDNPSIPNYIGITWTKMPDSSDVSLVSRDLRTINKVRHNVFHEMAHKFLDAKHCHYQCYGLMSEINSNFYYLNWEKLKNDLFTGGKHEILTAKKIIFENK